MSIAGTLKRITGTVYVIIISGTALRCVALIKRAAKFFILLCEDRWLLVVVAIGAYVVRRLGTFFIWLETKHENARTQLMILRLDRKNRFLERKDGVI